MIPMTAAEVDWLRPRHYAHPDKPGRCHWCDEDWPCNTARLIVTLDEARTLAPERLDAAICDHAHDPEAPLRIRSDHLTALTFRTCAAAIAREYAKEG